MAKFNKFLSDYLLKSELLKGATVLMSGSIIAQLISLFLQPLIRRLFTPGEFGIYSAYLSLVGIIIVISSLKFDDAIVIPKNDDESVNLLGLSLILNLLINLVIFGIVIMTGERLVSFLNLPENFPAAILLIIPVGAILWSTFGSLNAWLVRRKRYLSISVNKLIRRSTEGISQIGLGYLKNSSGLIFSDLIGQTANVATVAIQTKKHGLNLSQISMSKLKSVMRKYADFPKYTLIPALMSSSSFLLPPLFLNKYYSAETAGYFDLAKMVLSIPLAFITASFSSVLLQKISEKYNHKESVTRDLKPVLYLILLIATVEVITISIWGKELFGTVFGKEWNYSGSISRIMVWSFATNFIVSTFSSLFVALRKIKIYSLWQMIYFIAIVSLIFLKHLPFISFLKIYVLLETGCYLLAGLLLTMLIRRYEIKVKKSYQG